MEQADAKGPSTRVAWLTLASLAAGLAAGIAVHQSAVASLGGLVSGLEVVGRLWTNAMRMLVIPLVVSVIMPAFSNARAGGPGRLGALSAGVFASLFALCILFTVLVVPPLVSWVPADLALPGAAGRAPAPPLAAVPESGSWREFDTWVTNLVPVNPIEAAAKGDILAVLIFTGLISLALARTPQEVRAPVLALFRGVAEAVFVLLRWLLMAAPAGVFALAFSFGIRAGLDGPKAFAYFVVLVCGLLLVLTALLYPIATLGGKIDGARFARAVFPAQLVAVSTRSSLASLPALMEGAAGRLGLPRSISGVVLPLAVSTFKINRPLSATVKLLFLARVYGVDVDAAQFALFLAAVALLSISSPGLPSQGTVITMPAYLAAGLPLEGILLMEGVDFIPDVFKTLANVTADMTAAVLVHRVSERG